MIIFLLSTIAESTFSNLRIYKTPTSADTEWILYDKNFVITVWIHFHFVVVSLLPGVLSNCCIYAGQRRIFLCIRNRCRIWMTIAGCRNQYLPKLLSLTIDMKTGHWFISHIHILYWNRKSNIGEKKSFIGRIDLLWMISALAIDHKFSDWPDGWLCFWESVIKICKIIHHDHECRMGKKREN